MNAQVARALCGLLHNPHESPHLRISQEELASMASLSRLQCNRALSQVRDRGWIRTEYGGITLINIDVLQAFGSCGSGAPQSGSQCYPARGVLPRELSSTPVTVIMHYTLQCPETAR